MEKLLAEWFSQNKRDLPWRKTGNPYFIWLSEIILQQTQVIQGLPYYLNFTSKYPKITDLANAPEDEVLKLWQGLGYYSRARNLHKTAKIVSEIYGGIFPNHYDEIRDLPGIGDYTAAAITSFAFNLCYPVLDGNVARVISRMFGVVTPVDTPAGKAEIMQILNRLINKKHPGEFNQAIMEFGAIHCKPRQPLCETCPFQSDCYALRHQTIDTLPLKKNKTAVKSRRLDYLICVENDFLWIKKRTNRDIWQHLYDFPEADEILAKTFKKRQLLSYSEHLLSHQHLQISFWKVETLPEMLKSTAQKIPISEIFSYAMPKPINKFMSENHLSTKIVDKKTSNVKKL
ncbi:MAG: A/G-specific adenine glycosylase [Bacteroidales bacterium]|jgi:A/G-specific adenine glycosylase|nr:A/G-specific adenine glycosylase [Bacteroidales bacterium]